MTRYIILQTRCSTALHAPPSRWHLLWRACGRDLDLLAPSVTRIANSVMWFCCVFAPWYLSVQVLVNIFNIKMQTSFPMMSFIGNILNISYFINTLSSERPHYIKYSLTSRVSVNGFMAVDYQRPFHCKWKGTRIMDLSNTEMKFIHGLLPLFLTWFIF